MEQKRGKQYQKYYNYCHTKTDIFNPLALLKMELKGIKIPKQKYTKKPKPQTPKPKKEIPITYEEGCCYESRILDQGEYGI